MHLVITHSRTKREIIGPFNLCGNRETLRYIAREILNKTEHDFSYGWINITDPAPMQSPLANISPKGWD